ncbi:hypothetical protein EDC96DRAFT_508484 [Choanephora cucurbitarum]|nr:hypothetical protein EDC96DRAFT_508484 [Choanephora cucurbitarum]
MLTKSCIRIALIWFLWDKTGLYLFFAFQLFTYCSAEINQGHILEQDPTYPFQLSSAKEPKAIMSSRSPLLRLLYSREVTKYHWLKDQSNLNLISNISITSLRAK